MACRVDWAARWAAYDAAQAHIEALHGLRAVYGTGIATPRKVAVVAHVESLLAFLILDAGKRPSKPRPAVKKPRKPRQPTIIRARNKS